MEAKGTKGSFGHHSMGVIDKDIKKGGKLGKKAQFAKNMKAIAAKRHHKKSVGKRARKG